MLKIATLNYHNAYNYGAVFQAYALQNIIQDMGYDCDILNYRNNTVENQYRLKKIRPNRNLKKNIRKDLALCPFINKKKHNFEGWFEKYNLSKPYTRNTLKEANDVYDKFIVGSDQVWNLKCHGCDTSFLLDFVDDDTKKISYAASFGTYDISKEDKEVFLKYISGFSSISVREQRGKELVRELTGRNVECTLDPVLLAKRSLWERNMTSLNIKGKYIFVYQLGHGRGVPKFVSELKKETGLNVIFVTGHSGNMIYYALNDKNCSTASPEQFLSLLSNAEYVVTNSFHATALAIEFNKNFVSLVNGDEQSSYNTRIYSLLCGYGLKDRIMNCYVPGCMKDPPDFSIFNAKIPEERKKSMEYLEYAINKK